ncbi:putative inactive ATP-dependent zinc metalloprotease FTSHI 5, chloroplastic [Vitis vinifera]|uniref:Putative inactive ATP-dependent zinc metalloprotease FTSHI 5, chloroplastic n=1 Tax=Vitis vinifera TaxID=29760 RepID=A0A438IGW9_VITVI|nr:putative inactive ATP-dependent zinc metalloprotease FTSHI 5, chloroplastic [Vitis vinifera]
MPETTEPGFRKWKIENSMIMSWLINSMNNDIGENFLLFGTAKDIWDAAKETYSSSENTSELFQVESALHDFRQGEQSVTQYYNTLTRGRIMGIKPLPSLREAFSEVRREESRKKVMMGSKEQPAPTLDASALAARSFNSSGGDRQKRDRPWCDYCKKPGHYKETCWKLHGKPADWKQSHGLTEMAEHTWLPTLRAHLFPEPSPFNKEQMEMLHKLLSQVGSGSTTGVAFTANRGGMRPWIVDTGASDHMTEDAAILQITSQVMVIHPSILLMVQSQKLPGQDLKSGKMIGSAELCSGLYLLSCGQFSNQVSQASCVQSQSMSESFNSVSNSKGESMNDIKFGSLFLRVYLLFTQSHQILPNSRPTEFVHTPSPPSVQPASTQMRRKRQELEHGSQSTCSQYIDSNSSLPEENIGEDRVGEVLIPSIDDSTLPIALRKGVRRCTDHPIGNYVTYEGLSPSYRAFATSLDDTQVPNTIQEALKISEWKKAVQDEIDALEKNGTWTITDLPVGKRPVGCKWIFTIKYKADGSVERFKARLVARGFTQSYGIDYQETFAPVAKLNTIRILLSLAVNQDWCLQQLDIKNAFLNGDLEEEVYMEIPPGFEESMAKNQNLKKYLSEEFEVKDLGNLKYFLGMEVARSRKGIVVSQRKYILDLLKETGMLGCKPIDTPMDSQKKLGIEKESTPVDRGRYQRLVGRLIYLSHTRPDIGFAVSAETSLTGGPLPDIVLLSGEILLPGGVRSNQFVARSSAEAEYRALAQGSAAISIAKNPCIMTGPNMLRLTDTLSQRRALMNSVPLVLQGIGCTKITKAKMKVPCMEMWKQDHTLKKDLYFGFGSYVASQLLLPFGEENILSSSELKQAQEIATRMVIQHGWGPDDSPAVYYYSNAVSALSMGNNHEYEVAAKLKRKNRRVLEKVVEELLEFEILTGKAFTSPDAMYFWYWSFLSSGFSKCFQIYA